MRIVTAVGRRAAGALVVLLAGLGVLLAAGTASAQTTPGCG